MKEPHESTTQAWTEADCPLIRTVEDGGGGGWPQEAVRAGLYQELRVGKLQVLTLNHL